MADLRFLPNIDALVAPLDGDNPGGDRAVFNKLSAAVKELDRDNDDPDQYWTKVIRLCEPALEEKAKDLRIVRWVVNALPRQEVISDDGRPGKPSGFEALADALTLLHRLTAEGWEYVHPQADPESPDPEYRNAPFEWLGVAGDGACLPDFVRRMPLVATSAGTLCEFDWRDERKGEEARAEMKKVADGAAEGPLAAVLADIDRGADQLARLEALLKDRLKVLRDKNAPTDPDEYDYYHPGMGGLREAMTACRELAAGLYEKFKDGTGPEPPPGTGTGSVSGTVATSGSGAGGVAHNRDTAYRQMRQAAELLLKLEPHSPVPYLVLRACDLGGKPFPEMIRSFVRDDAILTELRRELNIPDPPTE